MDPAGIVIYATFGLVVVLILGLLSVLKRFRSDFEQKVNSFQLDMEKRVYAWAFEERKETVDGKEVTVRTPSQRLVGLAQVVAPVFIATGIEWAKANVKINPSQFIQGGAAGGLGSFLAGGIPPEAMKMIPKEMRWISILPTLWQAFKGRMGGGAATAPAQTAGTMKPFGGP